MSGHEGENKLDLPNESSSRRSSSGAALGEVIEAADFDTPNDAKTSQTPDAKDSVSLATLSAVPSKWWHSQFSLMLATFALLGLAAILFIAFAPPPELSVAQPPSATVNALPDSEAPWNNNQIAQARGDAQAILENLLDSKKKLETMDVLLWAPERFQAALDSAAAGDELYKEQKFAQAMQTYQSAANDMDSLFDLLPELITTKLAEADLAIQQGKSALATELYENVLQLDAGNIDAAAGFKRANKLDQVLALINQANSNEAEFDHTKDLQDLISAQQKLEAAKAVDEKYTAIDEPLVRVKDKIVDRRFKLAMTKAYQALFANRYNAARNGFAEALKIKPANKSARLALQQALASDKTASLSALLANAASYEQNEQWSTAVDSYKTVLQRDPNQISAKIGSVRAGAREQLDAQLSKLLADPLSFGSGDRRADANRVLADAKAISKQGPILKSQIVRLQNLLSLADLPIKISLNSNQLTEVSLQKLGSKIIQLGQFSQKNLALKPGKYVVKGKRLGYQDVRTDIELYPSAEQTTFTVSCEQKVASASSAGGG